MRICTYAILILTSIAVSMDARSQLSWNLIHSDQVGTTQYVFFTISCSGNNCTAGLTVEEFDPFKWTQLFYQTTDGGATWFSETPEIEFPGNFPNIGFTKIQRIDSLTIVAMSEEFIVRSSDAGKTWKKQENPSEFPLMDIHFSDPLTGILVSSGSSNTIFLTSDGGEHWDAVPYSIPYAWMCYSYGSGKFRLVKHHSGAVYTTDDNFQTVDSTGPIFDSVVDAHWEGKIISGCAFGGGDTILAYGAAAREGIDKDTLPGYNLIVRSSNGGKQWETPSIFFSGVYGGVYYTTALDRDTVVAVGQSRNNVFLSYDRGATWTVDTLRLDTAYTAFRPQGIAMTADGHVIGAFTIGLFRPSTSILVRGQWSTLGVYELISYKTRVFPNPATTNISIVSPLVSTPIYMHDIMGREVLRDVLSDEGELTIDIAHLPNGIYTLSLDYQGNKILVDKVVVKK